MKTIKFATLALFLAGLSPLAFAGPGPQHWQTLRTGEQFGQLKSGDKVALVCNQCKTVSEIAITSPGQAMELCKNGAVVMCPSCKMTTKVTLKTKRNDPPTKSEVTYVNDKGEECAFVAKVGE